MKDVSVPRDKIAELAWQTKKFAIDKIKEYEYDKSEEYTVGLCERVMLCIKKFSGVGGVENVLYDAPRSWQKRRNY